MRHFLWLILLLLSGCVVFQPRGTGEVRQFRAKGTSYRYWLYMPKGYEPFKKRPTVVSLHGLKPFDSAYGQCCEWQQQADIYGFVIVAPELSTPNLFAPCPLYKYTPDLLRDGEAIVGIMNDLSYQSWFDPNRVLITSWSYGGYLAHWIANRHPDLFTCLAVRQSNFCERILNPGQIVRYRYRKAGIFSASNDFDICKRESKQAIEWYTRHGFDVIFAVVNGRGHERIPDLAAEFFAKENK